MHLPREATVSGFGFWHDGRFLAAELKEREEARREHAAAAAEGRATALLVREGTVHSFSVFPVPAGGLLQVETTVELPVATERGRSHVRLPFDAFLGHAAVTSTAVVYLATPEPLAAFGVDGASPRLAGRGPRWARLAFTADHPVDLWWAEEAPPLLTRAEAVELDDGEQALQVRVALNDAGAWSIPPGELVLLVDASYSMRRRARAVSALLARVMEAAPAPVRVVAVAETAVEVTGERREMLRRIFGGGAGFTARWEDLERAAGGYGCSDRRLDPAGVRCLVVTDPQVAGLPAERTESFETLFLADADELVQFAEPLGDAPLTYQLDAEPTARLLALADELVLPVLEVLGVEQAGGSLKIPGTPRLRVAEGGLLRLFATTRSPQPLRLRLRLGDHEVEREVALEALAPDSRAGRALRRGLYQALLADWGSAYQKSRDPELRRQIVDVSVREGIPTPLTALHVAAPDFGASGTLPPTGTPAPLLRLLGWLLLLAGWPLLRAARHRKEVAAAGEAWR